MQITTPEQLQQAITKYRKSHPRYVTADFEGEAKEYPIEQPGLDIIEALQRRINELEFQGFKN